MEGKIPLSILYVEVQFAQIEYHCIYYDEKVVYYLMIGIVINIMS